MENTTIPSTESGGCGIHNTCVAVISLAVALVLIICMFSCGTCIRLIGAKYLPQASPFTGQDHVVVVVYNKIPSAAAAAESKDEDPC